MKKIKIVLADDHAVVLMGVRGVLERHPQYQVACEARSSGELVSALQREEFDIAITDFSMPGDEVYGDGVRFIGYLVRNFPKVKFLVFTMLSNRLVLDRLFELGVAGVVRKDAGMAQLLSTLDALGKGRCLVRSGFRNGEAEAREGELRRRLESLSVKEYEVLRLFVSGLRVSDIARLLKRSDKTISAQKSSAKRRLGVKTDQELLACCLEGHFFD
ncbi:response regulator [Pseudomonas panipatensis]|uniref:Two-component system, NarL family, captular synthesis response regulator RcsB n=1 Tax=Pseudomonas panipatensis TaxID=428992 RepID=A0A1G8FIY2_9PSED|nr:response regulator [Pseudomonas panipatensis]SDH82077.1 two-component system, NarL family, captular synthesis response regulator RcsB [Pseudomonas panipatensis]SMP53414.1 two component transcriptional regulator, LuxR family [Pseudomonas panipatensis]